METCSRERHKDPIRNPYEASARNFGGSIDATNSPVFMRSPIWLFHSCFGTFQIVSLGLAVARLGYVLAWCTDAQGKQTTDSMTRKKKKKQRRQKLKARLGRRPEEGGHHRAAEAAGGPHVAISYIEGAESRGHGRPLRKDRWQTTCQWHARTSRRGR